MYDRVHRALAHPVRAEVLALLRERGEASPKELAGELGQTIESTSYHIRTLVRAGLAELARTSHRRGAVKHHYRATAAVPVGARVRVDAAAADDLERRVRSVLQQAGDGGAEVADGGGQRDGVVVTVVVHRAAESTQPASDTQRDRT
jgi:DNA-binding transcriptional ArsR family regulator